MGSAASQDSKASDGALTDTKIGDYFALLKPRVMSLVVFTGVIGMLVAPGSIHPLIGLVAIICIAFGSGAAGALNMWYDRDIDAIMKRTQKRPIPSGVMNPTDALEFAIIVAFASVFIMAFAVNLVAAGLLLVAILFYYYIYTVGLKRSTPQNIVIGGAAGAFPPMIGWAATTGTISVESVVLFAIIFFWTPPHFWALALYRSDDYKNAGVPMLPVTHGHQVTKKQMLIYTLLLLPIAISPYFLDMFGLTYLIGSGLLSLNFIRHALIVRKSDDMKIAMKMFGFSILYLFAIFGLMVIDRLVTHYIG